MIQHFIITAFSYRSNYKVKKKGLDPLHPERLEKRFGLFEVSCLSSLAHQENQDFTWIIIVDPQLPDYYRDRLEQLISKRPSSHLYTYSRDATLNNLDWLKPWINPRTHYIITSKLDDDDALFRGFTRYISDHYNLLERNSNLPAMLFAGCREVVYWDFFPSKKAPLGYLKTIKHKAVKPSSAGFSVGCKYPELNYCILKFGHKSFTRLLTENDNAVQKPSLKDRKTLKHRKEMLQAAKTSGIDWDGVLRDENIHFLFTATPQAMVINHLDNIQVQRMFKDADVRTAVQSGRAFIGFDLNIEIAGKYISANRKSLGLFMAMIRQYFLFTPDSFRNKSPLTIFSRKILGFKKIVSGFKKMH